MLYLILVKLIIPSILSPEKNSLIARLTLIYLSFADKFEREEWTKSREKTETARYNSALKNQSEYLLAGKSDERRMKKSRFAHW